jgi:uncharacterized membrane protein YhaH (DUF805 family)
MNSIQGRGGVDRYESVTGDTPVAGGAVVGFPLFTSLALVTRESQQGAVVVTLLPAATALAAVARAGSVRGPAFWATALSGLAIVLGFTVMHAGGAITGADAFLVAAVAVCAVAYAEGGVLARELGGARTICWALVLNLPVTLPAAIAAGATSSLHAQPTAWLGMAYVTVVSMFLYVMEERQPARLVRAAAAFAPGGRPSCAQTYPWGRAAQAARERGREDWAVALETGLALPTVRAGR